jgi:hypothetical protein
MQDNSGAVMVTLRDPVYIYQSSRYAQRRLFYRPFLLKDPYYRYFVLVVVAYQGSGNHQRGEVVTAYAAANTKQEDILIWSKYEAKTP